MSTTTATMSSLKARQRQERESLILDAAGALLVEKGYHEMAMDDIAARVGIAKGTVYLHFPSKEDLIVAFLARESQEFFRHIDAVMNTDIGPTTKVKTLIATMIQGMYRPKFRLMADLLQNSEITERLLANRATWQGLKQRMRDQLLAVFAIGQAQGEFDPDLSAEVMLGLFSNLVIPHGYAIAMNSGVVSPEALAETVSRCLFGGIAAHHTQTQERITHEHH